jgi:hypothetical protein
MYIPVPYAILHKHHDIRQAPRVTPHSLPRPHNRLTSQVHLPFLAAFYFKSTVPAGSHATQEKFAKRGYNDANQTKTVLKTQSHGQLICSGAQIGDIWWLVAHSSGTLYCSSPLLDSLERVVTLKVLITLIQLQRSTATTIEDPRATP